MSGKIYAGASTIDDSAVLQVDSTTGGAIIPRMTTAQRDAISSPAESLFIFNTDTNSYNWYDDDNTTWRELSTSGVADDISADTLTLNDGSELTMLSQTITIAAARHTVDTEADATSDNLDTISGMSAGELCIISAADAARTVVLRDGQDNITCSTGANISLDDASKTVLLIGRASDVLAFPLFGYDAPATTAQLVLTAAGGSSPTTNGAEDGSIETTTNAVLIPTKDFDDATDEYVQWSVPMPSNWDGGTITALFHWSATAGTAGAAETVVWGLQAVSFANDDALDAAFGSAQTISDTWIADEDLHVSGETSAIMIAGSPSAGDLVVFRVFRDVSADDMVGDAQLISVVVTFGLS